MTDKEILRELMNLSSMSSPVLAKKNELYNTV
jgi:hypothetical protein